MDHTAAKAAVALLSLEQHLVEPATAAALLADADTRGVSPLIALIARSREADLLAAVAAAGDLELVDLLAPDRPYTVDRDLLAGIDLRRLEELVAVPLRDTAGRIVMVAANPLSPVLAEFCRSIKAGVAKVCLGQGAQIRSFLLRETTSIQTDALASALEDTTVEDEQDQAAAANEGVLVSEGQVSEWLTGIILSAISQGASDLHFERALNGRLLLRFRIDGTLIEQSVPAALAGKEREVISALMLRARMDSSNHLEPQDGGFGLKVAGRAIDARVGMVPAVVGPSVVVRLLDSANVERSLDSMGFSTEALEVMRQVSRQKQGTVIIGGPTGSGKTTSLYAMLREVASPEKKLMTAEEPVEYKLPWMTQVEVKPGRGERSLTFARALRQFLRQDPDVILVGETRDFETAETVAHAAMTGHLVFSTLHANSTLLAYSRLIDMGLERFIVAEAISLLMSQRLVRRVHQCATLRPVTDTEAAYLATLGGGHITQVAEPVGCGACSNTGYRGRIPILEILRPTEDVRAAVIRGASTAEMRELVTTDPDVFYIPMATDALRHVAAGTTTVTELRDMLSGS